MAASAGQSASKRSDTAHARLSRTTVIGVAMGPGFRRELNERKIPSAWTSASQDDQLLLEQEILRDHRSHATGSTQLRGHDGQVKQGEQESFMRGTA
jgi:hypothetical protein